MLTATKTLTPSQLQVTIGERTIVLSDLLGKGDSNTKLRKSSGYGYETAGFSIAPHKIGNVGNVCPFASPTCAAVCLDSCGLGSIFSSVRFGRLARKVAWYQSRDWVLNRLSVEIGRLQRNAKIRKNRLAVRLNVFSDIPWEKFGLIQKFPNVEFYDYTKNPNRTGQILPNYWVTFSRSETNYRSVNRILRSGANVAVVFHNSGAFTGNRSKYQILPRHWNGWPVIDGDTTDLRFDDPKGGYIVGLRLKAPTKAQRQTAIDSGFSRVC